MSQNRNVIGIDFEFIENGLTIEPISIGLAHIDGRRYYAIFKEFKASRASPWVRENVIAKLPPREVNPAYDSPRLLQESLAWKSSETIRRDILAFIGDRSPEFWGSCCAHDFVLLGRVLGMREQPSWTVRLSNWVRRVSTPKAHNPMVEAYPEGYPYFINDVQALRLLLGDPEGFPVEPENHVAIEDAIWVLEARRFLLKVARRRFYPDGD